MSACWADFDNHGKPDLYASNMWSAAGQRISRQKQFHAQDPEEIRSLYRRHASGNSLYRNLGHGKFANVSSQAGVEMGRWAWGSDAWDVDQDGYPDLYIANGYISGPDRRDLGSFFWRHVVGNSPSTATPSANYELGWNAINESIRSDLSWSGYERNTSFLNNRDGTFSDVSGAIGMDFLDDSRCFALADLDHDGRLEVVLKNRNAPQLRVLHNTNRENGNSISFRLTGTKSNRDAIGASVTVEAGELRQTKFVQAGSGFLAQHTKELFFGVGGWDKLVRATILWPSSLRQSFDHLPSSHRIEILEGSANFAAVPFATAPESWQHPGPKVPAESLPASCETWLIEPLKAPDFSLADLAGDLRELRSFQGKFTFLFFWNTSAPVALEQLRTLNQHRARLSSQGVSVVGVNLDDPLDLNSVKNLASKEAFSFPNLLATPEMSGIYNILYRYLFDRRRDMPVPVSFLIDPAQQIVKLYQAPVDPHRILVDVNSAPRSGAERIGKALPCEGVLPKGGFQRNDFTYGVAMFQRGYLREAAESFRQVIAAKPQSADAFYNLGTLYLRENNLAEARSHLERAVELRPNYAEAWNNLGMIAAQQGRSEEAVDRFRQALRLQPGYVVALVNLGNFYRRARNFDDAEKLFAKALAAAPDDPEANYGAGMLDAQREKLETALQFLGKAVQAKPDYADALNNIGVILVRQYRYADAEKEFKACIGAVPNFDQAYINLARLYVVLQNDSQAREVLNRLLALQPGNRLAQRALEMLR
jgi:Flp pilus assembly protein TadD/peroxiredoxin